MMSLLLFLMENRSADVKQNLEKKLEEKNGKRNTIFSFE